jgi:hypothetical protein
VGYNRLQGAALTGGGASVGVAFASALTAGSKMIAWVCCTPSQTISSVSDGTNNFHQVGAWTPTTEKLYCYELDTPSSGADGTGTKPTITATFTGTANGCCILIEEVAGLATGTTAATVLDGTAGTTNGTLSPGVSNTVSLGAYTSGAAGEYLNIVYADDGDTNGLQSATTPSGYTASANQLSSNDDLLLFYKASTHGTESPSSITVGATGTSGYVTAFVAWQLAATASVITPRPPRQWQAVHRASYW